MKVRRMTKGLLIRLSLRVRRERSLWARAAFFLVSPLAACSAASGHLPFLAGTRPRHRWHGAEQLDP